MSYFGYGLLWLPILALLLGGMTATLAWRQHVVVAAARVQSSQEAGKAAEAQRFMHLAGLDLRAPAMSLIGFADQLSRSNNAADGQAAGIASIAGQLLRLADDLQEYVLPDPDSRVLRHETLHLGPMLHEAIAAVSGMLCPARRVWRQAPEITDVHLVADRRAVAQILTRVLGSAARFSRDGDWIEISLGQAEGGLALIVADEGVGMLTGLDAAGRGGGQANRGLGLAMARILMEAHGGSLAIQSTAGVGTQVSLKFPAARLLASITS